MHTTPTHSNLTDVTPSSSNLCIDLHEVRFQYASAQKHTLHIPAWQVDVGQRLWIEGESGCGKTTLFKLLSGILPAGRYQQRNTKHDQVHGDIHVCGVPLHQQSTRARDAFRAQHIGLLLQQFNLIPYLSVADNIGLAHALAPHQVKSDVDQRRDHMLANVGLSEQLLARKASELSVGQQQRVAIVRALINLPSLVLVDEPTSALDSHNAQRFLQCLLEYQAEQGFTLLLVSHDQQLKQQFATQFDQCLGFNDINHGDIDANNAQENGAK